ncbi:phage baseplate assembly protein V [Sphingomonas sp.]|uniref:phage baseplate assembly protein V n=1 Tax=Sphingomonas sp. TaxID=28214 RepID=UPI003D6CECB1
MATSFMQPAAGTRQDRFFGKYRGVVTANTDPESRGRLQVRVPEVRGDSVTEWALPASPYAGSSVGFFAVPPVGANVWVEYEGGNLQVPIWAGCFWADGEIASADAAPEIMFLKTAQASIRIDNNAGEVKIMIQGTTITLTSSEAKIGSPQITLSANGAQVQLTPAGFDALQGALKVM